MAQETSQPVQAGYEMCRRVGGRNVFSINRYAPDMLQDNARNVMEEARPPGFPRIMLHVLLHDPIPALTLIMLHR